MSAHIRGRMRLAHRLTTGEPVYEFEVVDTRRGVVLHRDNSCGFQSCLDHLRRNVAICREAWHMGVLKKKTWCS